MGTSAAITPERQKEALEMQGSKQEAVVATMRRINRVWLDGRVDDLGPMVDPEIVTVFPGFTGRMQGRHEFLAGFRDFCDNAKVQEFRDYNYQSDVAGNIAVATFQYEMIYERSGERYRATGRDLWIFQSQGDNWIAVWRTMLDTQEAPV
jgi:hypothetical protein